MSIHYTTDRALTTDQFIALLQRTSLGERRPLDDRDRIDTMLAQANLLGTAWQGDTLVGVARCVTDFAYCCYLSDLAVDEACQKQGVGKGLIALLQKKLHPQAKIILLAAPQATGYYPRIGFDQHPSAWVISASHPLS